MVGISRRQQGMVGVGRDAGHLDVDILFQRVVCRLWDKHLLPVDSDIWILVMEWENGSAQTVGIQRMSSRDRECKLPPSNHPYTSKGVGVDCGSLLHVVGGIMVAAGEIHRLDCTCGRCFHDIIVNCRIVDVGPQICRAMAVMVHCRHCMLWPVFLQRAVFLLRVVWGLYSHLHFRISKMVRHDAT